MSYTLYQDGYQPWEINPEQLKHSYYVQLAPDKRRLVPGMLQQDTKPEVGSWIDVTKVDRDFPERYFAQYTDFNTLVPGSLVQKEKLPEGKWKEIKRRRPKFHRVVVTDPYNLVFIPDVPFNTIQSFTTQDNFNINRVIPILNTLYPDAPRDRVNDMSIGPLIRYTLYSFKGNFAALNSDPSKLIPFNGNSFGLTVSGGSDSTGGAGPWVISAGYRALNTYLSAYIYLADATYSFVLGILGTDNKIIDYIVFENIAIKSTSGGGIILPPIILLP